MTLVAPVLLTLPHCIPSPPCLLWPGLFDVEVDGQWGELDSVLLGVCSVDVHTCL